ncbi:MAG: hypothetical protein H0W84_04030 [Bacteroidetes bacterium]|nr:hypothetical protein [Bacteroidota bacterium]
MKKILVVYFTQSGQLNNAVKATLAPLQLSGDVSIHYEQIKPKNSFPFPWTYMQFFDVFPECVHGITCGLEPFSFNPDDNFDLIIIAYQPWFLSVSIPINSFLESEVAKKLLKNKNVVTLLACRNMWLNAQEKMKSQLKKLEANLVGNITYIDKSANLISLIAVLAFALGGVKDKFLGIFPKYGVSDKELKERAPVFGEVLLTYLQNGDYTGQQRTLTDLGAINIRSNLMLLEGRGKVLFPLYANYISKKGTSGSKSRRMRVRIFGIVLPIAILILSPIITIVSRLTPLLFPKKIKKEIEYYSQNTLR